MRPVRQADPFAVLGLPASAGLTDDEVRAAWRRIAAATHPDRADGGDAARFAAAAAAYTTVRTKFGRAEALADRTRPAGPRRWPWVWGRRAATGSGSRRGRPAAAGERRRRRPAAVLVAGRWWSRARRGQVVTGGQDQPGRCPRDQGGRRRPWAGHECHARAHRRGGGDPQREPARAAPPRPRPPAARH